MTTDQQTNRHPEWVHLKDVLAITGWTAQYANKLRALGVLEAKKLTRRGRHWYRKSKVLELLEPKK